MNTKNFMGISTAILSLSLMVLFIQTNEIPQDAFAENESIKLITQLQTNNDVSVEFKSPETIVAGNLVPINARVIDSKYDANLSHTDWSYSIIGPNGELVHKSTTLHGHFGVMNFKDSFPGAGTYTIKYTVSSSGPFMLGSPVPELGQTRAVVSGDLLKFEEDPKNNFGTRDYVFTVDVINQGNSLILKGSEPGTSVSVSLTTTPERIVVGQPTTFVIDVDDAGTGKDATHVDGLISFRRGSYYPSSNGDQPDSPLPLPLNGAYHGHRGVLSTTHTFSQPGTYIIDADLSVVPYSVPLFGKTDTRFVIQVFDDGNFEASKSAPKENTVEIVGLESPFYVPNTITVQSGQTITFDNVDGNQHTVTSTDSNGNPDGSFDSGLLQPGELFQLTLNEKGTYYYYCALHTNMRGTIIVS